MSRIKKTDGTDGGSGMKKGGRATRTKGPGEENIIRVGGRFTNTTVPRIDGGGCWMQHLQIVRAIVKSNGWTDVVAALQLFAHLGGEALDVALLMPEGEREKWECLSQGLSDYYNAPGRLAVFRWQFGNETRRPGMDPATLATELGILEARGFGDMGKRARDEMIRVIFIAAQRNCGMRRHLDGVPVSSVGEPFGADGIGSGCYLRSE